MPLTITITWTETTETLDGVPCRRWHGRMPDGSPCLVYVHRIAALTEAGLEALETACEERPAPRSIRTE